MSLENFFITSNSAEETRELGRRLGALLRSGDLVILSGELGAGKTSLVKGIGDYLGCEEIVSPTFVLACFYEGKQFKLVHVDAYRLNHSYEIYDLDLEEHLEDSVVVIEWGNKFEKIMNEAFMEIEIKLGAKDNERVLGFSFSPTNSRSAQIKEVLGK